MRQNDPVRSYALPHPEHKIVERILIGVNSYAVMRRIAAVVRRAPVEIQTVPGQIVENDFDRALAEIKPAAFQAHQLAEFAAAEPGMYFRKRRPWLLRPLDMVLFEARRVGMEFLD